MNSGQQAATEFYKMLKARNPVARRRWGEIVNLARKGDPEAIRAVRLMQSVMTKPVIGAVVKPVVTPQQIEMLRQILISARYSQPGQMPAPGVVPPASVAPAQRTFPQVQGAPLGYTGEGMYTITKPEGLALFPSPNMQSPAQQIYPAGTMVRVLSFAPPPATNGWVQVIEPASNTAGYVCLSCPEVPGGPWLLRKS